MIIDSSRLGKILDSLTPEDALSLGVMEVCKPPVVPERPPPYTPPRRGKARRPFNPRPPKSARAFILEYAAKTPTFSVSKQLVPDGVTAGYQKNTLYSTCTRLTKTGALKRSSAGQYQLIEPEPDKVT
jgi:hypothetical protein